MMPWSHIGRERMLLLVGERLDPTERSDAALHLQQCAKCRAQCASARVAHSVLADLTSGEEQRWRLLLDASTPPSALGRSKRRLQFTLLATGACAALASIVFALFSPAQRVSAKTTELLTRSSYAESAKASHRSLLLTLEGRTCPLDPSAGPRKVASPICDKASLRLKETSWSSEDILSSKSFLRWRMQQPPRHDALRHQSDRWVVTTSSESGIIQEASLELQEKSLYAVRLVLHFRDSDVPLVVTEGESKPELPEGQRKVALSSVLQTPVLQAAEDGSADRIEVRTWQILRAARADSAWLSSIVRTRDRIDVEIYAAEPNVRDRILNLFQSASPRGLDVAEKDAGPERRMSGAGPALSEEWLDREIPDIARQNEFKREVSRRSREVLGKAMWLDKLSGRRRALQTCECARELDELIGVEQRELLTMEARLASSLIPYIKTSASPHLLSGSDATQLDLALQDLFLSSELPRSKVTAEEATVRRLLNVN